MTDYWHPTAAHAQTQFDAGPRVPTGQPLLPGDLVFYGTPGNIHHVGLYVGGGLMINAPTFGQPVQIDNYRYNGGPSRNRCVRRC